MVDRVGFSEELLMGIHGSPLERREGLRNEEGGADCDLALSVSLVLRDLIIMLGDFFRQIGDALDILIVPRWEDPA